MLIRSVSFRLLINSTIYRPYLVHNITGFRRQKVVYYCTADIDKKYYRTPRTGILNHERGEECFLNHVVALFRNLGYAIFTSYDIVREISRVDEKLCRLRNAHL